MRRPDAELLAALWVKSNFTYNKLRMQRKSRQLNFVDGIADVIPESPCDSRFTSFTSEVAAASPGDHIPSSPV